MRHNPMEVLMVEPELLNGGPKRPHSYSTKKCQECFAYLPLRATVCEQCGKTVGEVDKIGFATKPFDWWGYIVAIIAIAVFCGFMWWGFFKE